MEFPRDIEQTDTPYKEIVFNYLDTVGNHERKISAAAIMLAHPHQEYSSTAFQHAINTLQGVPPVWPIPRKGVYEYCERGLVPGGVAQKIDDDIYRATDDERELKTALTGFLIEWSLAYKELSLQQALGASATPSRIRSPRVRYQIYQLLLGGEKTVGEVSQALESLGYKKRQGVEAQLKALNEVDIVSLQTKLRGYNPTLGIIRTDLPANASPEVETLHSVTKNLPVDKQLTLEAILDLVTQRDPTINIQTLRRKIVRYVDAHGQYAGLALQDDSSFEKGEVSHVRLSGNAIESVTELYSGVESVMAGEDLSAKGRIVLRLVHEQDSALFSKLVAKGKEFSRWHAGAQGRQEIESQLLSILTQSGGVSVEQAQKELLDQHQRRISINGVRVVLNEMAKKELIDVVKVAKDEYSTRQSNQYIPKQPS